MLTYEVTFKSSENIKDVKVIVTIVKNESLKRKIAKNIIMLPFFIVNIYNT